MPAWRANSETEGEPCSAGEVHGVSNYNSSATIKNSTVAVSGLVESSVQANDTSNVDISLSQLDGPITGAGTFRCFGAYDADYNAVVCP